MKAYFLFHLHELVADPQNLLEEKEALAEKLAIKDYENRLAQEDILKLKTELQKKCEAKMDEPSGNYFFIFYRQLKYLLCFYVVFFC